ncbi:hypothetical protein CEXT_267021 [Caerostris extrusa]|uniref:CASP-like protein n=1 Tax=Caerostris extrusa TaxID=172846 RepID=A0AAV4V8F2_CAEEX|nr:hypothetical protein CEXT_267021 [Caerostris extrusa]
MDPYRTRRNRLELASSTPPVPGGTFREVSGSILIRQLAGLSRKAIRETRFSLIWLFQGGFPMADLYEFFKKGKTRKMEDGSLELRFDKSRLMFILDARNLWRVVAFLSSFVFLFSFGNGLCAWFGPLENKGNTTGVSKEWTFCIAIGGLASLACWHAVQSFVNQLGVFDCLHFRELSLISLQKDYQKKFLL